MPEMPFPVAKGKVLAAMDARYSSVAANGLPVERQRALAQLRQPWAVNTTLADSIDTMAFLDPGNAKGSRIHLKGHLNEDWFGFGVVRDSKKNPITGDPASGQVATPTTGWWWNWKGEAEGVFRQGLQLAIEVSLGLTAADPPDATPRRIWPIEFLWFCGAPRFQVSVSWSADPTGPGGRVLAAIVTPGIVAPNPYGYDGAFRMTLDGPGVVPEANAAFGAAMTASHGMALVGQDSERTGGAVYDWDGSKSDGPVKRVLLTFGAEGVGPSRINWNDPTGQAVEV